MENLCIVQMDERNILEKLLVPFSMFLWEGAMKFWPTLKVSALLGIQQIFSWWNHPTMWGFRGVSGESNLHLCFLLCFFFVNLGVTTL